MDVSAGLFRYLVWALVVIVGALLAVVDWRVIKRPIIGVLLLLLIAGGAAMTVLSPFNFGDGGSYMEGIILAAGSALAFAGYLAASVVSLATRVLTRKDRA